MSFTGNVWSFFATVAAISVTGVMMPGPVTAAAIAKGYRQRWAGMSIALGHGVVEFPTIALMALGFSKVLQNHLVNIVIGLLGGAMLVVMGSTMMLSRGGVIDKLRKSGDAGARDLFPYHPFIAGIITTASNPYYFLWWATLGAALTLNALEFGLAVLVVFAVLHWTIDLGWDVLLSYAVHRSRGIWDDRVFVAVFALCGGAMVLFGVWFGASAILALLVP